MGIGRGGNVGTYDCIVELICRSGVLRHRLFDCGERCLLALAVVPRPAGCRGDEKSS